MSKRTKRADRFSMDSDLNPTWVRAASCNLQGTGIPVCTVIGFPLGATLADVKAYEARRSILDGFRSESNVGARRLLQSPGNGNSCLHSDWFSPWRNVGRCQSVRSAQIDSRWIQI